MSEIKELVNNIFSKSPMPENSYDIGIVPEEGSDNLTVREIFEVILTFYTDGAALLYGDGNGKVDLDTWTDVEINTMSKYCLSIGFKPLVEILNKHDPQFKDVYIPHYRSIPINDTTPLKTLKFKLSCKNIIVIISFDYNVDYNVKL